jgi:hypothetical protein
MRLASVQKPVSGSQKAHGICLGSLGAGCLEQAAQGGGLRRGLGSGKSSGSPRPAGYHLVGLR